MASTSGHCIFCDLVRGAAEVSMVYEDATAIAFLEVQPVNAGHVLASGTPDVIVADESVRRVYLGEHFRL